jgi:hypothetical protein
MGVVSSCFESGISRTGYFTALQDCFDRSLLGFASLDPMIIAGGGCWLDFWCASRQVCVLMHWLISLTACQLTSLPVNLLLYGGKAANGSKGAFLFFNKNPCVFNMGAVEVDAVAHQLRHGNAFSQGVALKPSDLVILDLDLGANHCPSQ